jgi:hypothetical protein
MKRSWILALGLLLLCPAILQAGGSPIQGGGNFGVGLEVGDPGVWGVTGKYWIDRESALQPAIKFGYGAATLQLDYLFHLHDLIDLKAQGKLPFYFGGGGDLIIQNAVAFGARGVVGLSYLFDRPDVPVDVYVQVAPTLWFFSGGTNFTVYGQLGGRYYF